VLIFNEVDVKNNFIYLNDYGNVKKIKRLNMLLFGYSNSGCKHFILRKTRFFFLHIRIVEIQTLCSVVAVLRVSEYFCVIVKSQVYSHRNDDVNYSDFLIKCCFFQMPDIHA
jgi:uncharacterized membrane protein